MFNRPAFCLLALSAAKKIIAVAQEKSTEKKKIAKKLRFIKLFCGKTAFFIYKMKKR